MHLLAACLVALAVGFFGSIPLAGPISVMVVSRAARSRYDEALHVALGGAVAEGIYAAAAFWGFTTFLAGQPYVQPLSHAISAALFIALGATFAVWRPDARRDRRANRAGTVLVGFSVAALNPTLLLTWSAIVAFLWSKGLGERSPAAAVPFGAAAAAGIAGWFTLLVTGLRRYGGRLPARALKWTVRVIGIALVGLGLWSGALLVRSMGEARQTPSGAGPSLCCPGAAERRA
jgi:threonine/homoserine/homoserine lactone efflux protein